MSPPVANASSPTPSSSPRSRPPQPPPSIETTTLVFHRAALGDFILIWPRLRILAPLTVVTDGSKGRLAARYIGGVTCSEIELPYWNALWMPGVEPAPMSTITRIVSYIADEASAWSANAHRAFPRAEIEFRSTRPPERLASTNVREWPPMREPAALAQRESIVIHAGAGSRQKRWPVERTIELAQRLGAINRAGGCAVSIEATVRLIAGEVEAEQWSEGELSQFEAAGGRILSSLDELADTIESARLYIGFDSGPTHLAAQLGVTTIALFGPTDPHVWAPAGPRVRVLTRESVGRGSTAPAGLDRIAVAAVVSAALDEMANRF